MAGRRGSSDGAGALMFVGIILLAIYILPFVGLWMLFSKDTDYQAWGIILIVVGIILWIVMACIS